MNVIPIKTITSIPVSIIIKVLHLEVSRYVQYCVY